MSSKHIDLDQRDLNRFLGLPSKPRQQRLHFRAQTATSDDGGRGGAPLASDTPRNATGNMSKMDIDSSAPTQDGEKSGSKRAAPSSSPADDHKPTSPSKKLKTSADSGNDDMHTNKQPAASSSKPKPPVSDFFKPREPAKPKAKTAPEGTSGKTVAVNGKGKEKDETPEERQKNLDRAGSENQTPPSGVEGEPDEQDDEDDSEAEEEESQTAVKLAEIFTRTNSTEDSKLTWRDGEPVPYAVLTGTFELIEKTTKRLEISRYLTRFLVDVVKKTPKDLLKTVYLCINRLCPEYEPLELGIGESILMKAIGESCGRKLDQIKADFKETGDLGTVAQASREKQRTLFKPKPLTVNHVFQKLTEIAKASGQGSQKKKGDLIKGLLAACVGQETKYLIRSLEGKLRIGLAERSVIVALAHAVVTVEIEKSGKQLSQDKTASKLEEGCNVLKSVFSELPSYNLVVPALLKDSIMNLHEHCKLTPGMSPMQTLRPDAH
ncbi:ATP-dependent DNA ligase Cdc17 [Microbotryomycetes sp. JL201]|nr:ATP-dependent DNA ligase Cdc17 [Microbotryomycetes sp. JL201]